MYPRKKCWQVDGKYLYFIRVCISFVSVLVFVYTKGGLRHEVFVGKKRWQVHMLCINTFTLFLYSHALYDTFLHYIALQPEPSHQSTFPDLSAHNPHCSHWVTLPQKFGSWYSELKAGCKTADNVTRCYFIRWAWPTIFFTCTVPVSSPRFLHPQHSQHCQGVTQDISFIFVLLYF